ncbi:MAG: HypC/HybG/HupF family hydrogenase formation chaperone [bacterium]
MCLAIPGKIIDISSSTHAKVDFGGVFRKVNVELVEPKVGDYVVVHAGFAISVLSAKDAEENLKLILGG